MTCQEKHRLELMEKEIRQLNKYAEVAYERNAELTTRLEKLENTMRQLERLY